MNKEILSPNMSRNLHLFFLVFVVSVLFYAHDVNATTYVTFNDGRLYVFPDTCLQMMTQEEGQISFIAQDGTVYSYPLASIASIEEQLSKELPTFTSFKFNNKYNYQVITDAVGTITDDMVNVTVAGIGKRLTSSFTLSDENARAYVDGKEQESKVSRLRFDNNRTYVVGYPGDMILTAQASGKYAMLPFGRTYIVNVDYLTDHSTSVPRIDINTVGGVNITSKIEYVDAEIIIDGAGVFPSMTDSVKIRGRGNTSWSSNPNSKNPYRLKFASKVKPLGLSKGKNWVLLANKIKSSMLTNAIGMKAASLIGTSSANHMIPVDLYINGTYKGSYNFTEKVGLAGNSVDIDDETAATLLELDKYYDEAATQKFQSTPYAIPVNIKSPEFLEDSTVLTLNLIKDRFNSFVSAVYNGEDFSAHVDMIFLARYLMVSELICNIELFHPKSVYCYHENILDAENKFMFGPLWDLDWAFGYNGTNSTTYFKNNVNANYYTWQLTQSDFFRSLRFGGDTGKRLYGLWKDFMGDKLDELCEFCQDYYQYAAPSFANNKAANLDNTNYAAQSVQAADWIRQRANFIFENLKAEFVLAGDVNGDGKANISDVTLLINYLLSGDADSINMDNSDMDGDGDIDINDVTSLINNLLSEN